MISLTSFRSVIEFLLFPGVCGTYIPHNQPLDAITARASTDGTTVSSSLSDTDLSTAARTATGKDVAFVFITADSGYAANHLFFEFTLTPFSVRVT